MYICDNSKTETTGNYQTNRRRKRIDVEEEKDEIKQAAEKNPEHTRSSP